jgi:ethanolamine utilization cobalamin adenosyltransferase
MKDFITEAWLRANHTLSEGAEIHLPADSRLTPSARELLESRHLRIKAIRVDKIAAISSTMVNRYSSSRSPFMG